MNYLKIVFCGLSTIVLNAYSAEIGLKARIQIKVFDGPEIIMHERNLTMIQECEVGFIKSSKQILEPCNVELTDLWRDKKSGSLQVLINGFGPGFANFQMTALANGYVGGGQDGPYFITNYKLSPNSVQDSIMNLGFYSRTPEIAQDYLVRINVLEFKTCDSLEQCSTF